MFELKPLSLSGLLDEELKQIPSASVDIRHDRTQLRALPLIMSVRFQLRQVLHDLLSNAMEALRTQPAPRLEIRAACNPSTRKVELEIADNGSGIPENVRERLFSPGVTTKPGKLGIGLWWSRNFMQASGGNLVLKHSELGKGTTFLVEIPCSDEYKGVMPPKPQGRPKDLLVVDDDPIWLEALADNLSRDDYQIATASSYSEAIALLADSAFKVALLDLRLLDADDSNIGGLDLLAHIGKSRLDTKVIMLSAFASDQHEQIARQWPNFVAFYHKAQGDHMTLVRNTIRRLLQAGANKPSPPPTHVK